MRRVKLNYAGNAAGSLNEKDYRDFRVSGFAALAGLLSAVAMDVPYPYLVVISFAILFTTGYLVRLNDTREAEWQKKADEKARGLEAKRLREESE